MSKKFIVGIDEVGRGALSGPVMVAAVAMPAHLRFRNLRDSKKLTPRQRETWYRYICHHNSIFWSLSSITPGVIDKINITRAANLAATRALFKLKKYVKYQKINKIMLDGGLFLINRPRSKFRIVKTVIRGDEKINSIKLASIVAKVIRDRFMVRLNSNYPLYGFRQNKGYGTKYHIHAIEQNGPSKIHRLTFIRKYINID